jgi:hypothetical protein
MSQADAQQRAEQLARNGWTRRFTAIGARLNEAIELYRTLGYEITLEPGQPGAESVADTSACEQCFVMSVAHTIYTRPQAADASELPAKR